MTAEIIQFGARGRKASASTAARFAAYMPSLFEALADSPAAAAEREYSDYRTDLLLYFANTGIQRIRRICRHAESEPNLAGAKMKMARKQIDSCVSALAELARRVDAGATATAILHKPKKRVMRRKGGAS